MELNRRELLEKVKDVKSVEELIAWAKENGIELTEEKAKECFAKLNAAAEISDDVLDDVVGGAWVRRPDKDERSRNPIIF